MDRLPPGRWAHQVHGLLKRRLAGEIAPVVLEECHPVGLPGPLVGRTGANVEDVLFAKHHDLLRRQARAGEQKGGEKESLHGCNGPSAGAPAAPAQRPRGRRDDLTRRTRQARRSFRAPVSGGCRRIACRAGGIQAWAAHWRQPRWPANPLKARPRRPSGR
jgi:hypothetical protein